MSKTALVISNSYDPWHNLAIEEYLLQIVPEYDAIFYLWQNQHTVVIGKNQNAWKECNVSLLEGEGGKLARRLSGGGAVYHDLGNLNFTFLVKRADYNFAKQSGVIVQALAQLGVQAETTGRNDIAVDGRKISGNAFLLHKDVAYQHGTLLVDVDLAHMGRYLNVSPEKMRAKGVDSVKARVMNLKEALPDLSIDQLKTVLAQAFFDTYGAGETLDIDANSPEIAKIYDKFSSWEWRLGATPAFDVEYSTRFAWGDLTLQITLKDATITALTAYSDAMDEQLIGNLSTWLVGARYNAPQLAQILRSQQTPETETVCNDIANWLLDKNF